MRSTDPAGGPRPGKHNWFRGGTLRTYDGAAQSALTALDGHIDAGLARRIWQTALDARGEGVESWFHGDVAEGNLLLSDGQLAAVIDLVTYACTLDGDDEEEAAGARRVLGEIFSVTK